MNNKFFIKELKYAYNSDALITHISSANKLEYYFLDKKLKIPLVFSHGKIVKKYWRKKSNINNKLIINHFGCSESIEHYNKKIEFSLSCLLSFNEYRFKGVSSIIEYKIKEINKIIDVVFLDSNNNVLVGIEIFNTNKKNKLDIDKFNKINFPIYEYDLQTKQCYPISSGAINETKTKRIKQNIKRIDQNILLLRKRISKSKKPIQEMEEQVYTLQKNINRVQNSSNYRGNDDLRDCLRDREEQVHSDLCGITENRKAIDRIRRPLNKNMEEIKIAKKNNRELHDKIKKFE